MLLDAYREVYFTGGVSSVYLWEEEEAADGSPSASAAGSFAGCFLILKRVGGEGEEGPVGAWESSHVVQVCEDHAAGACTCVCVYAHAAREECLLESRAVWRFLRCLCWL